MSTLQMLVLHGRQGETTAKVVPTKGQRPSMFDKPSEGQETPLFGTPDLLAIAESATQSGYTLRKIVPVDSSLHTLPSDQSEEANQQLMTAWEQSGSTGVMTALKGMLRATAIAAVQFTDPQLRFVEIKREGQIDTPQPEIALNLADIALSAAPAS
jgi:hypothetical protein